MNVVDVLVGGVVILAIGSVVYYLNKRSETYGGCCGHCGEGTSCDGCVNQKQKRTL